ncbi:MAG: CBS domain-containing protein [Candidatus Heimdallarchaeota archaeon]|nr:CBS domain-containing protein [Candidatus Heimdallarchaeota archaeon]MDH5645895.1 CBS domain-containing protein [Candidatus Heimdallarchaeota archaeon]
MMLVSDLHIEDEYITVTHDMSVVEVAKKLTENGIPDAVVIDDQEKVLGVLDDFDIVSKGVAKEKDLKQLTAKDIMFAPPPLKLDNDLTRVKELFDEFECTVLPVVDDERKLLGVVTIMDLMGGLSKEVSFLSRLTMAFRRG